MILVFAVAAGSCVCAESPVTVEGGLDAGYGRMDYRETLSAENLRSDWNANLFTLGGDLRVRQLLPVDLVGRVAYYDSDSDVETWSTGGVEDQRDRLSADGFSIQAEAQYDLLRDPERWLGPHAGLGYGTHRFQRSDFTLVSEDLFIPGVAEEELDVMTLNLGLDAEQTLSPKWALAARADIGWVFDYEVRNSYFGATLGGDGGTVIDLALSLRCMVTPRTRVEAGVRHFYQELDGTSERYSGSAVPGMDDAVVSFPDNELEQLSFFVGWRAEL